jgi:hypothetical protein
MLFVHPFSYSFFIYGFLLKYYNFFLSCFLFVVIWLLVLILLLFYARSHITMRCFVVCTLAVNKKSGQVSTCRIRPFSCQYSDGMRAGRRVWIPSEQVTSVHRCFQTDVESQMAPYYMGTWGCILRFKAAGVSTDRSQPTFAEVKLNEVSIPILLMISWYVAKLTKPIAKYYCWHYWLSF